MTKPRPHPCCNDKANMEGPLCDKPDTNPELTYERCKVCKCRHFTLAAAPLLALLQGCGTDIATNKTN